MKTNDEIRRDNLLIAIKRLRTAVALAEKADVSAAYLSQIKNQTPESKTGKPKAMGDDVARKIEIALGESLGWMDTEHTSEFDDLVISAPKPGLTQDFPTVSKHSINGDGPNESIENVTPTAMGRRVIPVISYVQAGMMTEAIDPYALGDGFETVVTEWDVSESTFALRIKGKSMLPKFEEGDTIIIDPTLQPEPGEFVVAKNSEEEATFKKYRALGVDGYGNPVFELVPLNDDFATLHSERDHLHIIGVLIEHRQHHRRR
ncbi:UNVERIFIED_ORG: SOS-response transcriptional repressor LexA [Burkholderia sp. 1263]